MVLASEPNTPVTLFNLITPALIKVAPVYVLFPDPPKVKVPVPFLVKVPVDVAIGSATLMLPDPPKVKLFVPEKAEPDETSKVIEPLLVRIVDAAPKVTVDVIVTAVPVELVKAPIVPPSPVPLIVNVPTPDCIALPAKSIEPPELTVIITPDELKFAFNVIVCPL